MLRVVLKLEILHSHRLYRGNAKEIALPSGSEKPSAHLAITLIDSNDDALGDVRVCVYWWHM